MRSLSQVIESKIAKGISYISGHRGIVWYFIVSILAIGVSALIVKENQIRWIIVATPVILFLLHRSNTLTLVVIMVLTFIINGLLVKRLEILPRSFAWGTDGIIGLLFLKSAFTKIQNRDFKKSPLFLPILLFFTWGILSAVLNSIPMPTLFLALKDTFRYILLFYAIINLDIKEASFKKLVTLFLIIMLIQIPLVIYQYNIYGLSDETCGTIGTHGTAVMLFLVTAAISILIGLFIYYKASLLYLLAIPPLFSLTILGIARAALIYIPITLIFLSRRFLHGRLVLKTSKMFLVLGILFILTFRIPFLRNSYSYFIESFKRGYTHQIFAVDVQAKFPSRLRAPKETLCWIGKDFSSLLIGYGFGSTKESFWGEYTGKLYTVYSPRTSSLSSTLVEMGFPGLIFYLWIILIVFHLNNMFFKKIKDNYWKAISFGLDGIVFMYVAGMIYSNIWRNIISFPFWFFFAIVYSVGKNRNILS